MPKITEVTNTWTEACTYLAEQLEKLEQRVYELEHPEAITTVSEGDDSDAGDSV